MRNAEWEANVVIRNFRIPNSKGLRRKTDDAATSSRHSPRQEPHRKSKITRVASVV